MAYKSNVFWYYNWRAVGMPEKYLIRFVNYDWTVLQESYVLKWKIPVYAWDTPEKPVDQEHQIWYDFSWWSPTVVAATADATYTAQYTQVQVALITFRQPTAYWASTYTTLQESYWRVWDTPTYSWSTPSVEKTNEYVYTFGWWDPTPVEVTTTDPVTYTAQFTQGYREYRVRVMRPSSVSDDWTYSSFSNSVRAWVKWNDSIDVTSMLINPIKATGGTVYNFANVGYVWHLNASPRITYPRNITSAPSEAWVATVTTPTSFTLASLWLDPVYDSYSGNDTDFWFRWLYEASA